MAKKYEFKPDKPRGGLFYRLHLSYQQRRGVLKWGLYALALLALSILQDVILCRLRIFGATTDLVPCGIFLICILEGTERGCVFALVASLVYLFSGTAPGPYAMVLLTFLSVLISALRQAYLQKGFSAAMLCTGLGLLIYEVVLFAIGLFLQLTVPGRLVGFVITAAMTMVTAPAIYYLLGVIGKVGGETWKE